MRDFQPAPTTTVSSLDGDRDSVLFGEGNDFFSTRDGFTRARCQWGFHSLRNLSGGDLVAECPNGSGRWTDPDQSRIDDHLCKICILRQEAVARVDGVCP